MTRLPVSSRRPTNLRSLQGIRRLLLATALLAVTTSPARSVVMPFRVQLWPGGVVPYHFSATRSLTAADRAQLRQMMNIWETALTLPDPGDPSVHRQYVRFVRCTNDCPPSHVSVRYNTPDENGNMCSYDRTTPGQLEKPGRNPTGVTILHFNGHQPNPVVLHELGHCLGLWHEQNRVDRDRWLVEDAGYCVSHPDQCTAGFPAAIKTADLAPLLGNYDYDSIMHYPSFASTGELRWRDRLGNAFLGETWIAPARDTVVSTRDISRVLQFYARQRNPAWGFFNALSPPPPPVAGVDSSDFLPDPYLKRSPLVSAVGTPAVAAQTSSATDVFARGSDGHLYWKAVRGNVQYSWQSIGCCFASDPAAISRAVNRLDVFAVDTAGDVQRLKYINGVWAAPLTIRGGHPSGGLRRFPGGPYFGPAVASRAASSLDLFVVEADGLLAVSSWVNENWSAWTTLGGGYEVTARPAAVAVTPTRVQLAVNLDTDGLFLPVVTDLPDFPRWRLGSKVAAMAEGTAPALSRFGTSVRTFIVNPQGRVSEWHPGAQWQDIGGLAAPSTGLSAATRALTGWELVMNGEDATGCSAFCLPGESPNAGDVIQPGGIWLRSAD